MNLQKKSTTISTEPFKVTLDLLDIVMVYVCVCVCVSVGESSEQPQETKFVLEMIT